MSTPTPADLAEKTATTAGNNPPSAEHAAAQAAAKPETPAQEPDWKAEARKWEERSKANKAAADELAALKEAQKTEAEKTAERLAALEAENAQFKAERQIAEWKAEVSKETGVPAAALAGDSLEAIQAHAEVLKPLIATPKNEDPEPKPRPVPSLGNQPAGTGNVPIDDQIAAAEKDGNTALVGALKAMKLGSLSA